MDRLHSVTKFMTLTLRIHWSGPVDRTGNFRILFSSFLSTLPSELIRSQTIRSKSAFDYIALTIENNKFSHPNKWEEEENFWICLPLNLRLLTFRSVVRKIFAHDFINGCHFYRSKPFSAMYSHISSCSKMARNGNLSIVFDAISQ